MEFLTLILSVITLIVFFVMASNIAKCVELLRGIYKELKDANDPVFQKARKFDSTNK